MQTFCLIVNAGVAKWHTLGTPIMVHSESFHPSPPLPVSPPPPPHTPVHCRYSQSLQYHIAAAHKQERPYVCSAVPGCTFAFPTRGSCRAHETKHAAEAGVPLPPPQWATGPGHEGEGEGEGGSSEEYDDGVGEGMV